MNSTRGHIEKRRASGYQRGRQPAPGPRLEDLFSSRAWPALAGRGYGQSHCTLRTKAVGSSVNRFGENHALPRLIGTLARRGAVGHGWKHRPQRPRLDPRSGERLAVRARRENRLRAQSSLAGLNPLLDIRTQLIESITAVRPVSSRRQSAKRLSSWKGSHPRAQQVLRERPFQLSGGMRQRVMIATAIAQKPSS